MVYGVLVRDELPGGGYEPEPQFAGSVGTCFSKIVSHLCTAIINVPVLKDHDLAGISVAMKNFLVLSIIPINIMATIVILLLQTLIRIPTLPTK